MSGSFDYITERYEELQEEIAELEEGSGGDEDQLEELRAELADLEDRAFDDDILKSKATKKEVWTLRVQVPNVTGELVLQVKLLADRENSIYDPLTGGEAQ